MWSILGSQIWMHPKPIQTIYEHGYDNAFIEWFLTLEKCNKLRSDDSKWYESSKEKSMRILLNFGNLLQKNFHYQIASI